jgi:RimJ/RimL family protein N-acetyltransferase
MNLELRDVTEADLPTLFEHQREPEANRVAAVPGRDREAFFAHWRTRVLPDPTARKQAIVADGALVGNVVSWAAGPERLVGYWIGSAHWGRGFATAALRAFLATQERARPLHAHVAVHNVGSMRVLEKCGFRPVGEPVTGEDGITELVMRLD